MQNKSFLVAVLSLIVAGSLGVSLPAAAQDRSSGPVSNAVWVGADGKYESDPDTALVQFNISAQQEKLPDAMQRASQAVDQVRELLRSNGIDPKDAQFSRLATQPVYDYNNPKRKLVGYRVEASISVKVKDFAKLGPITQGLSNMEVTNTNMSYLLDDMDAAKNKAVKDGMRRAHEMAEVVAQAGGRSLGELSYASVDSYEPQPIRAMPRMMKAEGGVGGAAPNAEFSAEKITVTAHVNALYNLK